MLKPLDIVSGTLWLVEVGSLGWVLKNGFLSGEKGLFNSSAVLY